jgi:3-deoxy-7-phosphoheptulonate synthase
VSITDACIGFAQTVPLLDALALAVQQRRGRA